MLPLSDGLPAHRFPVVTIALIAANLASGSSTSCRTLKVRLRRRPSTPDARIPMLGASGAISAVLGAFLALYPHARIKTPVLVSVVQIPAWVYLGGWFLYQLLEAHSALVTPSAEGSGVAFFAHIGGFVFGWLVARALLDAERIRPQSVPQPSALTPFRTG